MARALCSGRISKDRIASLTVIVILALVALFIGLRLYSVLGERTGHEQQPILKPADPDTVIEPRVSQPSMAPPSAGDAGDMAYLPTAGPGVRAILAADPPSSAEDPDWNPEDVRYSVVRWAASITRNAQGPSTSDPRTGEIIESDIVWYHNHLRSYRNRLLIETGAWIVTLIAGFLLLPPYLDADEAAAIRKFAEFLAAAQPLRDEQR